MALVVLTPDGLDRESVVGVARRGAEVAVGPEARAALEASAAIVAAHAGSAEPVYGVSTGFGSLATAVIPADRREELQRSLIRSHAAGMGPPVEEEVVRAMMLLRARSLALGYSGVRPVVVDRIVDLLNAGITPPVPEHGSLGASGDLAPLAHVALALIGEGECAAAAGAAGIAPITLQAKEGLALINGTDGMLGMLVLAIDDLDVLLRTADVTAAMSVEALMGTDRAFAADLMSLRPHAGQTAAAANLRMLLEGSAIVASHRTDDPRRAGRLLIAVHSSSPWRGPRRSGDGDRDGRYRVALGDRQPHRVARRSRRVVRTLPRCAGRVAVRLPGDRLRRGRLDRRAAN